MIDRASVASIMFSDEYLLLLEVHVLHVVVGSLLLLVAGALEGKVHQIEVGVRRSSLEGWHSHVEGIILIDEEILHREALGPLAGVNHSSLSLHAVLLDELVEGLAAATADLLVGLLEVLLDWLSLSVLNGSGDWLGSLVHCVLDTEVLLGLDSLDSRGGCRSLQEIISAETGVSVSEVHQVMTSAADTVLSHVNR